MRFDENLRNLRKDKDYSQEYLAEKLGVTRQTISKWENGSAMPDLKKLIELAEFFEVSMDSLLGTEYPDADTVQNDNPSAQNCGENNEFKAAEANRYTNNIVNMVSNKFYNVTTKLTVLLSIFSVVLVIAIVAFSSSISTLKNQVNNLNNTVAYLQERLNSPSYTTVYNDEEYYDVEIDILKIYPETPYIVQAELKYAPTSYPKNTQIYYLVPNPDGGVTRFEAEDNNGEFVINIDIDLSVDQPIYFILDDGENIVKQEVYFDIRDVMGGKDTDISIEINNNGNNEYTFKNVSPESFVWRNTEYVKASSADIVVMADDKEVYRKALSKSELKEYDDESYYDYDELYYEFYVPSFLVKDIEQPEKFEIYIEVTLDNDAVCRNYVWYESDQECPDEDCGEYVFIVGDKTLVIKG